MVETGDDSRFVFESRGERVVVQEFGWQHLECDRTIESWVVRLVYRSHAAFAEQTNNREWADSRPLIERR